MLIRSILTAAVLMLPMAAFAGDDKPGDKPACTCEACDCAKGDKPCEKCHKGECACDSCKDGACDCDVCKKAECDCSTKGT